MRNTVREQRKKQGLTQAELADKVQVSRQTIISMEKGSYVPSLELALDLAVVFDLKIEDLFEKRGN
ncbi:helix-turn-helix transcriptional regulator [Enterococcus sp. JM9B]|uniref:helix-turn-helix transcriptional regulator n=1 Tax=Enterococcus sp. JM9B TaxID=1857216 RepID=UPI001374E1BF|nr:helix-turn-helix transcriptional regulator [Enterococcus sp. JM9B]KAF1301893.1 transcriptional regulator [Enterococcus sp. JM9B]